MLRESIFLSSNCDCEIELKITLSEGVKARALLS